MPDASEKTVIDTLSANILDTRFEDLDQATIDNARNRIMDVIGDIIGGTGAPGNAALVNLVKERGGKKEATILGYGIKAPASDVAMVNSILCNSFDAAPLVVIVDGKRYPSHTSGTTVPVAITMGENRGITGKELIATLVAADDFVARLLSLSQRGGAGSPGTTFGAAAIAGRLLGLDLAQLRNAFGIALDERGGGGGGLWDGSASFKMGYGKAARYGIIAAQLAKGGWIGAEDPLFGEHGSYYGHPCDHPEILIKDLGKKYYMEAVFKPYPGCRLTHAGIDAALALVSKHEIQVKDIEEVTLILSPTAKNDHCWKPFQIRSYPTGDALFSYRYSVATALVRKRVINENFTEESIRDPEVQALIGKIKLAEPTQAQGVELRLRMRDGRLLSESVTVARGDITTSLSRDEMVAKFMTQVEFSQTVDRGNAGKLLQALERLEEVADIHNIIELAVKTGK